MIETARGIRALDELQRRVHVEGLLFAVIGTAAVALTVGYLQWFPAVPTFSVGWMWVDRRYA